MYNQFMNKNNKIQYIWLDIESSGLDNIKHDVLQIGAIPVIDGVRSDIVFNQYAQPFNWKDIAQEALNVNKLTIAQLKTFQMPNAMVNNFITYLRGFNCKFIMAGYNVGFDRGFIASLFKKVGKEKEFFELFSQDTRDTLKRARKLKAQLPTPNMKLSTLCTHFNIEIDAHNAISDISATIDLDKILSKMLGEVDQFLAIEEQVILDVNLPEPAQLHCHSMFSHTDSINSISEWIEFCLKSNIPAISFVDHANAASLFDIVRIPAIIEKINKENKTSYKTDAVTGIPGVGLHLKVNNYMFYINGWAISEQGYKNLIELASLGWTERVEISEVSFPILSLDQVIAHRDGIVFGLPGVNGPITQLLISHQPVEAQSVIETLNNCLDIRLELAAIDVYNYFDSSIGFMGYNVENGNIQKIINQFYFKIANELNIKLVPVSDCHYIDPDDKIIHDCVCKNSYKDARYFSESRPYRSSREIFSVLKSHLGDALDELIYSKMVENTHDIMRSASSIKIKYEYHLPKITIPDFIQQKTDDYDMQCYYYTMYLCKKHGRWNDSPDYIARFKKEIDVIMKNTTLNFLPYFLIYEDMCAYCRVNNLPTGIARGSAGGSLLSFYLKIIHVDPVVTNLPFERFLSHARIKAGSFPDIDLDIAKRARPLVIKYLQDKYQLGFAQMATFSTMKTKNAIKDAMYALYGRNRNDPEVRILCDSIEDSPQGVEEYDFLYGYTDQEGEVHKGEVDNNPILSNFFKQKPEVETIVKKLIGVVRGWSRHASAFVISTIELRAGRIPTMIMTDKNLGDITVTQYDASMVEKSGLVKADILGIKTLNMVADCINLVKKNHDVDFYEEENGVPLIYRLPDADPGVFADFYNKDTDSSFQFNTPLIQGKAQEFAPQNRKDLTSMTAIYRPGAMDAPFQDTTATQYYVDVRNGVRQLEFLHPDLEPILKESNGIFQFQEEIMLFLVEIVGYTWEESDIIRSAIAKKKHEVIMGTFSKIRESCLNRGWSNEAIETICQQVQAFSNYSFNKSHSFSYAELGYITLYLKHHYPLEWWCSVLNSEDDEDTSRKFVAYLGDKISAPSLRNPSNVYYLKEGKIVTPISAIKGIGPAVINELMTKGPFSSLEDYAERVNHARVNVGSISALIKARAADDLMDLSIENYIERRLNFIERYSSLRKSKPNFKPDMMELNPLSIFLQEKEFNQSFNKSLLSVPEISKILISRWPALQQVDSINFPYKMVSTDREDVYLVNSIKTAESLIKNNFDREIAMILLYQGSNYKSGISKSGRQWHRVAINLTDGFGILEATQWDAKKALGWTHDSLVYIRGKLKTGWRTTVGFDIVEIEQVK